MHFEEISKYIIPILLLLYFFSGKKKGRPNSSEDRKRVTPPLPLPSESQSRSSQMEERSYSIPHTSPPPIHRKLSKLESSITTRHFPDRIEENRYISSISDERAQSLISTGLNEHINIDPAYALKPRQRICRGKAILNRLSSPQEAFILQVIINQYEWK